MELFALETEQISNIRVEKGTKLISFEHFFSTVKTDPRVFHFTVNEKTIFRINAEKKGNTFIPLEIYHSLGFSLNRDICSLCNLSEEHSCSVASKHLNEIFEKVVNHPSIRLRLLF